MATLATKYRPKTFDDVVEQSTTVEILRNMCQDETLSCRNFLLIGSAGCGKAQPMSSKVLTTSGYKMMKDIKKGDITFTSEGKPTVINAVFDQGKRDIYEIYLEDGSSIRVADSHINLIAFKRANGEYTRYNMKTTDLVQDFSNDYEVYIPATYPIDPQIDESIDTLLLAALRMYGHFDVTNDTNVRFRFHSVRVFAKITKHLRDHSIPFQIIDDTSIECKRADLHFQNLKYIEYNLTTYGFNFKSTFIVSSLKTRLNLFRDIVDLQDYNPDTDQSILVKLPYDSTNAIMFADEFVQLCESLGYIVTLKVWKADRPSLMYRIQLNSTVDSKFDNCLYRKITNIKCVGPDLCRCLWVEDEDHTYLTEHCIPTHNTTLARIMGNTLNENKGEIIEIDAASNGSTESVRNLVQQANIYPVGSKYKVFILDECFTSGTMISTPHGDYPIEKMREGDEIYSARGRSHVEKVHRVQVHKNRLMHIVLNNGKDIYTTVDHLFMTKSGWIPAYQLKSSDKVYTIYDNIKNLVDYINIDPAVRVMIALNPSISMFHPNEPELSFSIFTMPKLIKRRATDRGGWISKLERYIVKNKFVASSQIKSVTKCSDEPDFDYSAVFDEVRSDPSYVWMYDLQVAGHPSYFADGLLVHNCHSYSQSAWQVWLKTLEESPARSILFYCTTNPEKIPATVLSRVQTFQLSKISLHGIENRLKYVIDQENAQGRGITYTDDAISFLAKLANGGMRDALTLTDKALAYSKDINSTNLEIALNLPSYDDYFELLSAYAKKDNERIIKVLYSAFNSGTNFVRWLENFAAFVTNIVKFIYLKDINATMIPAHYASKLSKYSEKHAAICLSLAKKMTELNNEVRYSTFQLELAMTYLLFQPTKESK